MAGGPPPVPTPDVHAARLYNELVGAANPDQAVLANIAKAHHIFRNAGASASQMQEAVKYMAEGRQLAEKNREAAALAQRKANALGGVNLLKAIPSSGRGVWIANARTTAMGNPAAQEKVEDAIKFEAEEREQQKQQIIQQVESGQIDTAQAKQIAAGYGNQVLNEEINKHFMQKEVDSIYTKLKDGSINEATARANALALSTEHQEALEEKFDQEILDEFKKGKKTYTDIYNYAIGGAVPRSKLLKEIDKPEYAHLKNADDLFYVTNPNKQIGIKNNRERSAFLRDLGNLPEYANLPPQSKSEINQALQDFQVLAAAARNIDKATLARINAETNVALAEQFNIKVERGRRLLIAGGITIPLLILAVPTGGAALIPLLGAGSVLGYREFVGGRLRRAQENLKIQQAKESEIKLKTNLKSQEKLLPKKRELEEKDYLVDTAVRVIKTGNKDIDAAAQRAAIEKQLGLEHVRTSIQQLEEYISDLKLVANES